MAQAQAGEQAAPGYRRSFLTPTLTGVGAKHGAILQQ